MLLANIGHRLLDEHSGLPRFNLLQRDGNVQRVDLAGNGADLSNLHFVSLCFDNVLCRSWSLLSTFFTNYLR